MIFRKFAELYQKSRKFALKKPAVMNPESRGKTSLQVIFF